MTWITAKRPSVCFDCCSSIWSGATVLIRDRSIHCAPCGKSLERRLKEREGLKRGAYAHGKATQEPGNE